jgi:hypothetical protein
MNARLCVIVTLTGVLPFVGLGAEYAKRQNPDLDEKHRVPFDPPRAAVPNAMVTGTSSTLYNAQMISPITDDTYTGTPHVPYNRRYYMS